MYFLPTDDQLELQRGVRDLLAARFPLDRLSAGYDAALWSALAEVGAFSLRSELGLGWAESVLVVEEIGRAAAPGPVVATMLAAEIDPGHAIGPVAVLDLSQQPRYVVHLDVATSVLVLGEDDCGIAAVAAAVPVDDPVDPLSPLHEVAEIPSYDAATGVKVADLRNAGALLTAAVQVGLAARVTELAVDYAKTREQFGRTIGSFQAVKHICADMFVRAELARVALHAAAVTMDEPRADDDGTASVARAVAGAKLLADEAATLNGRAAVQVHGGMGFTWEVPVHFFLKRAWLHATEFGSADEHAEALADSL